MILDMRTIVLFTMIFNFLFGVGMFLANRSRKDFKGVTMIGYGFLISAVGFLLMFLREFIPIFYSVVICNTLILIGVILSSRGLICFYKKKLYKWWYDGVAVVIFFGLFCFYLFPQANTNMRIIIICIYLIYYYLLSLYAVIYKPVYKIPTGNWFMASFLIAISVYYVFRIQFTVFESRINSFMDAGIVHSTAIIMFAIWSVVICFGVFIVMNEVNSQVLEQNAYFDSLTNLYNRRALTENDIFKLNSLNDNEVAYVICDIDKFKGINDTYGHLIGDKILKDIALTIKSSLRKSDIAVRYGGDEFFLFLPNVNETSALDICDKLRGLIEGKLFEYDEQKIKLTMSFGVYVSQFQGIDCSVCIDAADSALYKSKEKGRNCIEVVVNDYSKVINKL